MALEKIGVEATIQGLSSFRRGIRGMDDGVEQFGRSAEGASVKSIALGNILADLAVGAMKAVFDAITKIVGGMIELGVESVKLASDFQDSLTVLQLSARDTGLSMGELSDVALQVGGDTSLVGVSATGAAEAMTGLFKAGLTTTEVFGDLNGFMGETAELGGALRAAIDLAAASELDMVQASDLAAVALSTFGGDLETAEERAEFINFALNNMVQAADASVAEVGDLAQALKNVGPTAAAMGFDIEEVNNALALLSTRGISGAEAGTNLKSALLSMTRPVDKVQDELRALNVELFDNEGNMKDLRTIVGDLEGAMSDLTQEERNRSIQVLAGSFGQATLNTLLAEGVDGWDDMASATAAATTIQEQAFARTQTLSGQMEALDGVLETLKIQIGSAFLPVATEFAQWAATIAEDVGPKVVAFFERFAEGVTSVVEVVRLLVTGDFRGGIFGLMEDDALIDGLFKIRDGVQSILEIGRLLITGDFRGGIFGLMEDDALIDGLFRLRDGVIETFGTIQEWLQELLPVAIQILTDLWNEVVLPIFAAFKDNFESNTLPALQTLFTWLQEKIPVAIATLSEFWDTTLLPAIKVVVDFITETVIPIMGKLRAWLIENIPAAIEVLADFWENVLKPALDTVHGFLQKTLIPIFKKLKAWLDDTLPVAIQKLTDFWENILKPALEIIWDFISTSLFPLFKEIADFLVTVLGKNIELLAALWETVLQPALEGIWEFIKDDLLPIFKNFATLLVETLFPGIETVEGGIDKLRFAFEKIKEAINFARESIKKFKDAIANIKLPAWLNPSSPPPLFFALRDISGAMDKLSAMSIPRLQANLDTLAFANQAAMQPTFSAGGGGSMINNNQRTQNFNVANNFAGNPTITDRDELAFLVATIS